MKPAWNSGDLAAWTGGAWEGKPPAVFEGITQDTRSLKPGMLYVALEGARFNGHRFIDDAFARGAAAAMVRNTYPEHRAGGALLRVVDPQVGLQQAAVAYRRRLAPKVVGITGSVGKSTVKELIAQMLAGQACTAKTQGNFNNHIGLPLSLLAMPGDTCYGIFEIGTNHPGEISALCRCLEPDWGVITNVGPVHIEHFGSEEAVAEEKRCLFRALPPTGRAFLCADGMHTDRLREACPVPVTTVGWDEGMDVRGTLLADRRLHVAEAAGDGMTVQVPLPGRHQALNVLLAVAVVRALDVPWSGIENALACFQSLPMRWQEEVAGSIRIINDAYNANPLSMRASLCAFCEQPGYGPKWVVIGGMRELGVRATSEHEALGKYLAGLPLQGGVVVGDEAHAVMDGLGRAGDRFAFCPDTDTAADWLCRQVRDGDAVFFKASRGIGLERAIQRFKKHREENAV